MKEALPHYLLFSEAASGVQRADRWHFALESVQGDRRLAATDQEPGVEVDRLELLAVVRGLEALEQPSRVTLITRSRYVSRGLERGLRDWRRDDWQWERFGRQVPIRDADLWQRIDRALQFHQVHCRTWTAAADRNDSRAWSANSRDFSSEKKRYPATAPLSGKNIAPPAGEATQQSFPQRKRRHTRMRNADRFTVPSRSQSTAPTTRPMSWLGRLPAAAVISILALARLALTPFSAGT